MYNFASAVFFRNSRLYCKKLVIHLWFKVLSLATTFSHLSGSVRIPRRKNWSSFEAIHESIQFFYSRLQGHALYLVGPARRSVLWTVKTQYNERHDKVILQHDNARPHVAKVVKTLLGNVEKGNPTPPAVFSRHCSLWLSLVSINGTRPGWPALPVLWRSKKLDRFVDSFKRWPVFSMQDSYATRKMGESSDQRQYFES